MRSGQRDVFARLEKVCRPDAILARTSPFAVAVVAVGLAHPGE
jgi:hypothetical protein